MRHRRRVLVVDDDAGLRDFVCELLDDDGYECVVAADGDEAIQRATDDRPALLLLDIQMPRVNGREVARELRMRLRDVPLVVMTGQPHPEREADRCNAVGFLAKPFDADALLRLVHRYAR